MKDFIDAPVKTYSSGMYMRLGFAVAIHVDPDVLLVDEVLAVGDEGFTHKCLDKFAEFKRRGKTILLVTHALGAGRAILRRSLVARCRRQEGPGRSQAHRRRLHHGRRAQRGSAAGRRRRARPGADGADLARRAGVGACCPIIRSRRGRRRPTCSARPKAAGARARWRSPTSCCRRATASGRTSSTRATASTSRIRLRAPLPIDDFVVGIGLFNAEGVCCYGTNTNVEELQERAVARRRRGRRSRSTVSIWSKAPTSWTSRFTSVDGYPYDYHRLLYTFRVKSRTKDVGIYRPQPLVAVSPRESSCRGSQVRSREAREHGGRHAVAERRGSVRAAVTRGRQAGRLHQRCLRPAPSRARPLPAGGAHRSATR